MNPETNVPSFTVIEGRKELYSQGDYRRTYTDFRTLEHALLSGDLPVAREAFASLKEDLLPYAETLMRDPFPRNNRRLRVFKELERCLLNDDLPGAKKASQQFQ